MLVIKLSALGDFVMSLGAARAVRDHHPHAKVTLLTTPFLETFAQAAPYFDHVETDGRPKGLGPQHALLKRLSASKYDMVYDFQTSNRTGTYWKLLRRLPHLTAPPWSGAVRGQALFHANPLRHTLHPIDRLGDQLTFAEFDLADPPLPDLSWVRHALGDGPELHPSHFQIELPFALLIPGASAHRSAKRWPEDRYAALATRLAEAGITPVIIGGPSETDIASEIAQREPRTRNIVGKTSLFQIVTLAERAAIAIGNDTGPMHMATLSGAPGVALFATDESDPVQACPRGAPVKTVSAARADGIPVEAVWDGVQELLSQTAPP